MTGGILAAFAHPDDESFSAGGTLAHYAAQGVPVTLVCATRGEAGEIADESLATPDTLGAVREQELRCAAAALGVDRLVFLNYRDSGMAGTPENHYPDAFANAPAAEVVARLVALIRRQRPAVVLTFDPDGGYGHPDHIAAHRHTTAAVEAAADPDRFPDAGEPWQVARLVWSVIPRSVFEVLREQMEAQGMDTAQWDQGTEQHRGWPDDEIDVILDVSDHLDAKWRALECHRTQFAESNPFRQMPEAKRHPIMSHESFVIAYPDDLNPATLTGLMPQDA